MRSYDAVVIGAGVFGSWTAYQLRTAGWTVALIDAYGPGNARSSSGGESRIIRMSYGPDEIYARWSWRSLALWKQFLASAGQPELFQQTGVLWTAPEEHPRAAANRLALTRVGVPFESLTRAQVERRFPQILFASPVTAVFEPESGVLLARRAVEAVVREAIRQGVDFIRSAAERPAGQGRSATVKTGPGEGVAAAHVVYACGAWLGKLFPELLKNRIRATRQEVFFFGPSPGDARFAPPAMPVWLDYCDPRGGYAIPDIEGRGFKLAFDRHGPEIDPDSMDRVVDQAAIQTARNFLSERFPALARAPVVETRVCQYENTANGDFLIGRHPDFENVWLAGGGSGHGFKHGPAVGEYVAGLLAGKVTEEPRFALAGKGTERARSVY